MVQQIYLKQEVDLMLGNVDINTALRSAEEAANKAIISKKP
jgi:hypothetical protein